MRRSALLLTAVLVLASGAFLIGARTGAPDPRARASAETGADGPDAAVVRAFYAAVDATLAGGDPAPLAALLAPDFADRAAGPGGTGDGLVRRLLALRAAYPALRVATEDVREDGDRVLARVRVEGADRGVLFGAPFTRTPGSRVGLDVLRVAGGKIAERWAAGVEPAPPAALVRLPLAEPLGDAVIGLARLTVAPGAHEPETALLGPLALAVEAGTLTVTALGGATLARDGGAATAVPATAAVDLGPGDGLLLPPSAHYAVRNAGSAPAVVLAVALVPLRMVPLGGDALRWPGAGSPDVVVQPLGGATAGLPVAAAEVVLGRVALAPGSALAAEGPLAPALVAVEAGSLLLATASAPPVALSAGQATGLPFGSYPNLRNGGDGPLVVLLVVVTAA